MRKLDREEDREEDREGEGEGNAMPRMLEETTGRTGYSFTALPGHGDAVDGSGQREKCHSPTWLGQVGTDIWTQARTQARSWPGPETASRRRCRRDGWARANAGRPGL